MFIFYPPSLSFDVSAIRFRARAYLLYDFEHTNTHTPSSAVVYCYSRRRCSGGGGAGVYFCINTNYCSIREQTMELRCSGNEGEKKKIGNRLHVEYDIIVLLRAKIAREA